MRESLHENSKSGSIIAFISVAPLKNRDRREGRPRVARAARRMFALYVWWKCVGRRGKRRFQRPADMFCRSCLETWTRLCTCLCASRYLLDLLYLKSVGECGVSRVWARKGWINVPKPPEPDAASATESESLCLRCRRRPRGPAPVMRWLRRCPHTYCLDPPLSCVPEGKWFVSDAPGPVVLRSVVAAVCSLLGAQLTTGALTTTC